jgi:RNA polymerase sigma factor (sigma-70 family)
VNKGAIVGHHDELADYVTLGPGATLCGNVSVATGAFVGAGAVVNHKISIGANAVVGSGSLVRGDVPEHALVAGNPETAWRRASESQCDRKRRGIQRRGRLVLVGETFGAQLVERALPFRQPAQPHPRQDPVGLRELDVAVVDDLEVVAPGIEEVVVAEQLRAGVAGRGQRRLAVVDDEPDVARPVGGLRPARGERDELVAQVDERHRATVAAAEREFEDPAVERERLVQVADLDRDVVDADCAGHRNQRSPAGVYAAVVGRPLDERELVARAQRGDADAYEELVRAYQGIAFRTAYVLAGSAADAEEAAQDGFVKAYRALWRFRAGAAFKPWLLRIVANEARNRRRAAGRRTALALRAAQVPSGEAAPSPEAALLDTERRGQLMAALERLSESDREAIACRYLLDLSEAETAAALGVRRGTVKSRLSRALDRLRAELGEELQ